MESASIIEIYLEKDRGANNEYKNNRLFISQKISWYHLYTWHQVVFGC